MHPLVLTLYNLTDFLSELNGNSLCTSIPHLIPPRKAITEGKSIQLFSYGRSKPLIGLRYCWAKYRKGVNSIEMTDRKCSSVCCLQHGQNTFIKTRGKCLCISLQKLFRKVRKSVCFRNWSHSDALQPLYFLFLNLFLIFILNFLDFYFS